MAKNPNKKVAPKDETMNGAMKFFLAGCVAELYLLILRRFYINADSELTRIAWYDHYLWTLAGIGAGVLAVGVIAALVLRGSAKKQKSAWILAAAGAFVGAATALVRLNMATLSFMTTAVPVMPVQAKVVTTTTKSTVVKKYVKVNYSAPKGSGACWVPPTVGYRVCVSFIWS